MRIEDRVEDVDARLKGVAAEVQGLMQMPGIYGAEYGKIRTALEGHGTRFNHLDARLREHDKRFDRLEELISDQGQELREQRDLLEQILAKVA
jgi:hypothetical protein